MRKRRNRRTMQRQFPFFGIVIALLILGIFFQIVGIFKSLQQSKTQSVQKSDKTVEQPEVLAVKDTKTSLSQIVGQSLKGTKGNYSIYIKHLGTNESYSYNAVKVYPTASLYKLWIMAVTYQKIEAGELQKDQVLTQSIKTLNRKFGIASEAAELKDGEISLTVHSALKQMISISHNYASLLLSEKVKLSTVREFLFKYQLSDSKISEDHEAPISTAKDVGLFLEKMYRSEFTLPQSTKEMLELLRSQTKTNKIPLLLPPAAQVANKTGEIDYFSHDAAIISTPNGDYILVIFSESQYPQAANERIAQLSLAIYEYMTKK